MRMFVAMISGRKTISTGATFGSSSPKTSRGFEAPCAIAASTNSWRRSESTSPRTGRARYGT